MKKLIALTAILASVTLAVSCDDSETNNGKPNNGNTDGGNTATTGDGMIGAACQCEPKTSTGNTTDPKNICTSAGYQLPDGGNIKGCDKLIEALQQKSTEFEGIKPVCLRSSSQAGIKPQIYFTNGMCSAMVTKCVAEGNGLEACKFAQIGDSAKFDSFTVCPTDNAIVESFLIPVRVAIGSLEADLHVKACFPTCTSDAECRTTETDPVYKNTQTQRRCIPSKADTTKKICADPRIFKLGEQIENKS